MKLGKYNIEVLKATHGMALKKVAMQIEALKHYQVEDEKTGEKLLKEMSMEETLRHNDEIEIYCSLIACSMGKLPDTYDKFCNMSSEDIDTWVEQAAKLNPRWFPNVKQKEPEPDSKKELE